MQRIVRDTFKANPDMTYTVADLAMLACPGAETIEKKHRVAVLRAATRVCADLWWRYLSCPDQSGAVFFNLLNFRSYATGLLRADAGVSCAIPAWCFDSGEIHRRAAEWHAATARRDSSICIGPGEHRAPDMPLWLIQVDLFKAIAIGDVKAAKACCDDLFRMPQRGCGWPRVKWFYPEIGSLLNPRST